MKVEVSYETVGRYQCNARCSCIPLAKIIIRVLSSEAEKTGQNAPGQKNNLTPREPVKLLLLIIGAL